MADHSDVRLAADVTLEGERDSFSNRGVKRKILSENNVLSACSACSFWRTGTKIRARQNRGGGRGQSEIAGKAAGLGVSKPLKTGAGGSGGLKTSQNWTNQFNSTSEIAVQNVGNPVF
jgi:hypothetical protein